MNMIINILGRYIVIVDIKLRKIISVIENDLGLIRYLLKIFREYTLIEENGYLKFENKKEGEVYLHRVIMEYYSEYDTKLYTILTNPSYYEINHKNKIKWDNRLENLEFVTHRNNGRHSKGLKYETIMTSQEIIQIKDKLKVDKQYQANKKYLEKASAYCKNYINKANLSSTCDKKFYDNLYIKLDNSYIIFKKSVFSTNSTTQTTIDINTCMYFTKLIFTNTKNTFFTIYNTSHISYSYNTYRLRNILQNNLQLVFKYYKQNKYFRTICNRYHLLNHKAIQKYKDDLANLQLYYKDNIIIDLFYYLLPQQDYRFTNNQLGIIIVIYNLLFLVRNKYESLRIMYRLKLLNRARVKYNINKSKYKHIEQIHIPTGFFIPKYTDDLFTTTVLPLSKQLCEDKPTRITNTILTKNYGLDTAQRVYRNPKLERKTERDLLIINNIITILSSPTLLQEVEKYGFIPLSFIRVQLQLINPTIEEKHQSFINTMIPNILEIRELLKTLGLEYMTINNKTKEKIKRYQKKNELEETTYEGITHRQNLIVLKKLVVKNTKSKKTTKKKPKL